MTLPRKSLVCVNDTPFYHCVSRCVRRAFLCGYDPYSRTDYEHRRDWLENKLLDTAEVFAIDLCAYAVMSNHYHVVLHLRPDAAESWSFHEVVQRWHRLFNGTLISQQFLAGDPLGTAQMKALAKSVTLWRARLCDLSWYMRIVNEHIARKANAEEECTGRFWEGRFKSQALLDEKALLSCMAYVDLNPIRAKMANTLETSDHTSVKARIEAIKNNSPHQGCIAKFVGNQPNEYGIPFYTKDYINLVDWSGRQLRYGKRGFVNATAPPHPRAPWFDCTRLGHIDQ